MLNILIDLILNCNEKNRLKFFNFNFALINLLERDEKIFTFKTERTILEWAELNNFYYGEYIAHIHLLFLSFIHLMLYINVLTFIFLYMCSTQLSSFSGKWNRKILYFFCQFPKIYLLTFFLYLSSLVPWINHKNNKCVSCGNKIIEVNEWKRGPRSTEYFGFKIVCTFPFFSTCWVFPNFRQSYTLYVTYHKNYLLFFVWASTETDFKFEEKEWDDVEGKEDLLK